jgi:chromosome segregation ATPase
VNIVLFVIALLGPAAVFLLSQRMLAVQRRDKNTSTDRSLVKIDKQIKVIDELLERAISHLESQVSLNDLFSKQDELQEAKNRVVALEEKQKKIDAQLAKMQEDQAREEAAHNEIKKGKEGFLALAKELRQNKDTLENERATLEREFEQSVVKLTSLSSEISLTDEQQKALDEINQMLNDTKVQLKQQVDVYRQAEKRFENLQKQYSDLEEEFARLVDLELSGKI